jgi:VWFA-related protein
MRYGLRVIAQVLVLLAVLVTASNKNTFAQRIGTFGKENYSTVVVEDDTFRLDLYFNLVDGVGQVLPSADVERVDITLQNNTQYSVEPTQPNTPFFITLVLDISGSMAGRANVAMREAVQQSLGSAPENAQFSIIAFHSEVITLQEFTGQPAVAQAVLSTLESVNGGGTCLYDAMWNALNKAKSVPTGRRAIIVFTDGVDENSNGDPCSVVPVQDVIEEAIANRIPLYTVGLVGQGSDGSRVATDVLQQVSDTTGGLSFSGAQEDLGSLFGAIMEALSSQWFIQATMYPDEGEQIAKGISATGCLYS